MTVFAWGAKSHASAGPLRRGYKTYAFRIPHLSLGKIEFLARVAVFFGAAAFSACRPTTSSRATGALAQSGYLWQRDWTTSVGNAFVEAQPHFDAITILGGEIVWENAKPRFVRSSIRWDLVATATKPITVALRVAPYGGPFARDDANAQFITTTANSLLDDAANHNAKIAGFQLDFDCAQKNLAGYRQWLIALRSVLKGTPLSITALPAWLDEAQFNDLLGEIDDYVLQVHSVPLHDENGRATLCDPSSAKDAVKRAAKLGHRFRVALPTYRCLGGYDANARLLSVAMDAVQPKWPGGTRVIEFTSDPAALAHLVAAWNRERPAVMTGLSWYRIPSESDVRNWRWPTLHAVMPGREPAHPLEVARRGENPIDLELINIGEADEQFTGSITGSWRNAKLVASDSVAGWQLQTSNGRAVFTPEANEPLRLLPGERRGIGWLRYDQPAELELVLVPTTR